MRHVRRRARACGLVLGLLAVTLAAQARVIPPPGRVDPRVRTVLFETGQVYELEGAIGVATDISLQPGERIVGFAGGDLGGITVSVEGSHVFLKPKVAPVRTNLTLLTNRRVYRFDYDVATWADVAKGEGAGEGVIYAVQFTYPAPRASQIAVPRAKAPKHPAAQSRVSVPVINRRYLYAGARALQPLRAWDDGVETHLVFAARQEIPAIFVRFADGTEGLVNFTVVADGVIVHRVAEHLILRRGRLSGCIWDQAYRGAGARLPSETVVPGRQRVLTAVRP
jgi:type IV secretion system protein VirB9